MIWTEPSQKPATLMIFFALMGVVGVIIPLLYGEMINVLNTGIVLGGHIFFLFQVICIQGYGVTMDTKREGLKYLLRGVGESVRWLPPKHILFMFAVYGYSATMLAEGSLRASLVAAMAASIVQWSLVEARARYYLTEECVREMCAIPTNKREIEELLESLKVSNVCSFKDDEERKLTDDEIDKIVSQLKRRGAISCE